MNSSSVFGAPTNSGCLISLPEPSELCRRMARQDECGPIAPDMPGPTGQEGHGGGVSWFRPLVQRGGPPGKPATQATETVTSGPSQPYQQGGQQTGISTPMVAVPSQGSCQLHAPHHAQMPRHDAPNTAAHAPLAPLNMPTTTSDAQGVFPSQGSINTNTESHHRMSICSSLSSSDTSPMECVLLGVNDICLQATQNYLTERRINNQLRSENSRTPRISAFTGPLRNSAAGQAHRWAPYPAGRGRGAQQTTSWNQAGVGTSDDPHTPTQSQAYSAQTHAQTQDFRRRASSIASTLYNLAPTQSLLTNISIICSELWRQSQRDRTHVPGTEKIAVENMAHLLRWGETIAWVDVEEWMADERRAGGRILAAGKNLCSWLGDECGRDEVDALEIEFEAGET